MTFLSTLHRMWLPSIYIVLHSNPGLCSSRFVQNLTICIRIFEILKAVQCRYDCMDYPPAGAKPHCMHQNSWIYLYCTRRGPTVTGYCGSSWITTKMSLSIKLYLPLPSFKDYTTFHAPRVILSIIVSLPNFVDRTNCLDNKSSQHNITCTATIFRTCFSQYSQT